MVDKSLHSKQRIDNSNHPNKKGNEVCVFHVSLVAHDMVV